VVFLVPYIFCPTFATVYYHPTVIFAEYKSVGLDNKATTRLRKPVLIWKFRVLT
jgi:hypothetical protein